MRLGHKMKINVLIIDQALDFGGSIVSTANLIRGLDSDKFNVIFCSSTNENLVKNKLREAANTTDVHILKKGINYGNVERYLPYRNLENAGLKGKLLKVLSYAARLIANTPFMLKIIYLVLTKNIHIIQINNGLDDEICLVAKLLRKNLVSYFRGYTNMSNLQKKYFVHQFKYFFSVSEYTRQEAIADGVPGEKIIVATPPAIPETISNELIQSLNKQYRTDKDTLFIGIFGRITPWKGQREFIEAANIALASNKNIKFFIVGDVTDSSQAYFDQIQQQITKLGIENNIVFTGYIENIYDYYELMDIVLHTSVEPEPSGRVIFEAMSQGKVVIASSLGGPKEFIEHNVDGFIIDPLDSPAIASTILELASDPSKRSEFGERARKKMEALYNKNVYAKKISDYYTLTVSKK